MSILIISGVICLVALFIMPFTIIPVPVLMVFLGAAALSSMAPSLPFEAVFVGAAMLSVLVWRHDRKNQG